MTEQFYQQLPQVEDYSQMLVPELYSSLPEDWWLVLTDVKGSTKAIQDGNYKQVNMVGVSSIIAVQNAIGDLEIPFIFGGDGATLAIPSSKKDSVERALAMIRKKALDEFQMTLRISLIPASDILKTGSELKVAKMRISDCQTLAVLRGSGWNEAEKLMKQSSQYELSNDIEVKGSMEGLECRWNPIKASRSEIMALIIQSKRAGAEGYTIYRELLKVIFPKSNYRQTNPIRLKTLPFDWPSRFLLQEARLKTTPGLSRWIYIIKTLVKTLFISLLMNLRGSKKNLEQPFEYLKELTENTDFLKFDENLRVVIDISENEKTLLLKTLEDYYQKGMIYYGYHIDSHALMTCFVQGPHKHIHFVDAANGGYALAAKMLKSQIQAAAENK